MATETHRQSCNLTDSATTASLAQVNLLVRRSCPTALALATILEMTPAAFRGPAGVTAEPH